MSKRKNIKNIIITFCGSQRLRLAEHGMPDDKTQVERRRGDNRLRGRGLKKKNKTWIQHCHDDDNCSL